VGWLSISSNADGCCANVRGTLRRWHKGGCLGTLGQLTVAVVEIDVAAVVVHAVCFKFADEV
jgi:hypothetical protein